MKCFNKIEQSKSDQVKNRLSSWISKSGFTYRAEVEPDPSFPYRNDEIKQRLEQLVFAMNKKYLKSSFPKWSPENRFYIAVFQEGNKILGNIHYHLLIHVQPPPIPHQPHRRGLDGTGRSARFPGVWRALRPLR